MLTEHILQICDTTQRRVLSKKKTFQMFGKPLELITIFALKVNNQ